VSPGVRAAPIDIILIVPDQSTSGPQHGHRDEVVVLWTKCYQAEVFGEAYFVQLLSRPQSAEVKIKVEALAALERSTKELMIGCLERRGISTAPDPAVVAEARASVTDYEAALRSAPSGAAQFLDHYARLRELADKSEIPIVDALIAHELAAEVFARRELVGDTSNSLQPLLVLSHVRFT
jgi:hypothetical protein